MTDVANRNRVQAGVPTGGQFATEAKSENGDMPTVDAVTTTSATMAEVQLGDTVWIEHNPIIVTDRRASGFGGIELTDSDGKVHQVRADSLATISKVPLEPFNGDLDDREDLDDWSGDSGHDGVAIEYNSQGFGQVSAYLRDCGSLGWHGVHYLNNMTGWDLGRLGVDPDKVDLEEYVGFNPNDDLEDGRTKGEAFNEWMADIVPSISTGVSERYGWDLDLNGDDYTEMDLRPCVYATAEKPGPLSDDEIVTMVWDTGVKFRNESDPGSFGSEYPYDDWVENGMRNRIADGKSPMPW